MWQAYIEIAQDCGLFGNSEDSELWKRLRGANDAHFYGAMAECMVCWFIKTRLGLNLKPGAPGKAGKVPDFIVSTPGGDLITEVKAPFEKTVARGLLVIGDDDISNRFRNCIRNSNRQFEEKARNLLFLVPKLPVPVCQRRNPLTRAFYFEPKAIFPFDTSRQKIQGPGEYQLWPDGAFLCTKNEMGRPRFTRVGAVACIEEKIVGDYQTDARFSHDVLMLHNPHGRMPLSNEIFRDYPQLLFEDEMVHWSDGHPVYNFG
jgi:hypothetical protein